MRRDGQRYAANQMAMAYSEQSGTSQPIIEVDGKIQFRIEVPPDGEATVAYKVHYSW